MDQRIKRAVHLYNKALLRNYSKTYRIPIALMGTRLRSDIIDLYGFLRVIDEIVDTPGIENKQGHIEQIESFLKEFSKEQSLLSPQLIVVQELIKQYEIDSKYFLEFVQGMKMDINLISFTSKDLQIYTERTGGVIGLIALKIACGTDNSSFSKGHNTIFSIACDFQKLNLIRDLYFDKTILHRQYFSQEISNYASHTQCIAELKCSMRKSLREIDKLPRNCRFSIRIALLANLHLAKKLNKSIKSKIYDNVYA